MELGTVKTVVKSGNESFHLNGKKLNQNLLSFWQWANSEILSNTLRGVLAEYIVSIDVKCPYEIREEWDAFDLISHENVKIEVKSSSYIQSWQQTKLSNISFGIQPTVTWDKNNTRSSVAKRQSDVYVFCLLAHKEQRTIDPLNLEQWEFYVLSTSVLDAKVGNQKTIALSSLLKLNPKKCKFGEINEAIKEVS